MKKILYFAAIIALIGCSNQKQNQNQQDNENEYSLLKLKIDSILKLKIDSIQSVQDSICKFMEENPNSQKTLDLLKQQKDKTWN